MSAVDSGVVVEEVVVMVADLSRSRSRSRSRQQEVEVEEEVTKKKLSVVGVHVAVMASLVSVELARVEDLKCVRFAHHASHGWSGRAVWWAV
jgi:hypothetical protein